MKLLNNIQLIITCAVALCLQSCIEEQVDMSSASLDQESSITINIAGDDAQTRADNTFKFFENYDVNSLRILAFNELGYIERNIYLDSDDLAASDGLQHTFRVTKSKKKSIYVVINEPNELADKLTDMPSQMHLAQLSYQIAEALNNRLYAAGDSTDEVNRKIPMCGSQTIDASEDSSLVINVDRVVARVDLMVDKDDVAKTTNVEFNSSTTVNISGLYYQSKLFEPKWFQTPTLSELQSIDAVSLNHTTALKLHKDDKTSAVRILSFYMAERTYEIDLSDPSENRIAINIDKISVEGTSENINSTILLGSNVMPYLTEINRNYIYRIFATYKGKDQALEVTGEYVIEDWVEEELDGDIEGVLIATPNQVVMDWSQLNNSFTAKDVAFGSNRRVEIYVPTAYDIATNEYTFALCTFVASPNVTYDLRDLSLYGIADEDNYLRKIKWLTAATITFDSKQTGHFDFTYYLADTPYHEDSVPLEIRSANVRKRLNIIYDNGFVPGDLLDMNDTGGNWEDAVNGVMFAKRGAALHPLINTQVIPYNSAGRYEGDVVMSATDADQYCKNQLGPKWYAPNKEQLADIQKHVLELGTSYRYNNTDGSYYWSSEAVGDGNYWAVDFTRGLVAPPALSIAPTNDHHIRCITNL